MRSRQRWDGRKKIIEVKVVLLLINNNHHHTIPIITTYIITDCKNNNTLYTPVKNIKKFNCRLLMIFVSAIISIISYYITLFYLSDDDVLKYERPRTQKVERLKIQ